jgi:hypothetical protein
VDEAKKCGVKFGAKRMVTKKTVGREGRRKGKAAHKGGEKPCWNGQLRSG